MLITKTVQEIAALVGGCVKGEYQGELTGVSSLKEAMATDVAFLGNEKYAPQVLPSKAGVVLVPPAFAEEPPAGRAWIVCENPSQEFTKVVQIFTPPPVTYAPGIHPSAVIEEGAVVAPSATVEAHVVISRGAVIGEKTVIGAGSFIGQNTHIGDGCLLYPNVTVRERCILGNRVILHPGVVIGADGFGYDSGPQGHTKIPQVGIVQLDDDVEIGANSCVDRARFGRTWIQAGTKIDNLVQVAHNVQIGRACILVSQVGIAGSTIIGDGVIIGGQAGVAGHLHVGSGTMIGGQAGVIHNTDPKSVLLGSPALDRREFARQMMYVARLPELVAKLKQLAKDFAPDLKF